MGDADVMQMPDLYTFFLGGLFLQEAAVFSRHIRNLSLIVLSKKGDGLNGKIEYRRWMTLQQSAVELLGFAALYLVLSIIFGSWFFMGGAILCGLRGWQHWRMGAKIKAVPQSATAEGRRMEAE